MVKGQDTHHRDEVATPHVDRTDPLETEQQTSPVSSAELRLIGGFEARAGGWPFRLGASAQRLLVLLAVRDQPLSRAQAAGILWPDVPSQRAAANLRSVLWRLHRSCAWLDTSQGDLMRLPDTVRVDLHEACESARQLLHRKTTLSEERLAELLHANFNDELLPDWDEEWLIAERERFRQLRLHALEALCGGLTAACWYGAAVDLGLAVVRADPLRESGHGVLISAYMAEGNYCEALRQFRRYEALVRRELRVDPSPRLRELLRIKPPAVRRDLHPQEADPRLLSVQVAG
jgi:DNA-binding SARP family transcriptional activator